MSVASYTPGPSKIVHESRVDFRQRVVQSMIHIVQYDKSLPIIAVELYSNGQKWALPSDANVKVRWGKRDHTYVYLDVLGCNADRTIVYFEIVEQMTVFYGEHNPVLEVLIGESVACSSYIPFYIDRNPIQRSDIESVVVPSVLDMLESEIRAKQDILVSGTNIKTINGQSILGSGNINISVDPTLYYTKAETDTLLSAKQAKLVSGSNIKTINGSSLLGSGDLTLLSDSMIFVTYSELVSLRSNGSLIPGMKYRLTDYTCTTTEASTSSANHKFDIILVANSKTSLLEEAHAIQNDSDNYFDGCNLSAWKLWYSLDNDTTRFSWADSTNGKGVIYRMIDEYGNEAPYDFKNIMYAVSDIGGNVYTFTCLNSDQTSRVDASLYGNKTMCMNNKIEIFYDDNHGQLLNFIKMIDISSNSLSCSNNTFGKDCSNITLSRNSDNNVFVSNCKQISCGVNFNDNIINIGASYCKFGDYCTSNTIGSDVIQTTFGNRCLYNTIGDNSAFIIFGNYCSRNTIGINCARIAFGSSENDVIDYCRYIQIDNGCANLYVYSDGTASSSNYLQNIHVHLGVKGASPSSRIHVGSGIGRNNGYSVDYYMDGSIDTILD